MSHCQQFFWAPETKPASETKPACQMGQHLLHWLLSIHFSLFCFWYGKFIIHGIQNIIGRTNSLSPCLLVPFVTLKILLKNISKCILKISMTIVSSIVISVRRPALEGGSWRHTWNRTEKLHANTVRKEFHTTAEAVMWQNVWVIKRHTSVKDVLLHSLQQEMWKNTWIKIDAQSRAISVIKHCKVRHIWKNRSRQLTELNWMLWIVNCWMLILFFLQCAFIVSPQCTKISKCITALVTLGWSFSSVSTMCILKSLKWANALLRWLHWGGLSPVCWQCVSSKH